MMTIKVNLKNDYIVTRINDTLERIAKHYFSHPEIESIDILDGGLVDETEFYKMTVLRLYKASPEEIKKYDLICNIREIYKIEYKPEYKNKFQDREENCGFMRIA